MGALRRGILLVPNPAMIAHFPFPPPCSLHEHALHLHEEKSCDVVTLHNTAHGGCCMLELVVKL